MVRLKVVRTGRLLGGNGNGDGDGVSGASSKKLVFSMNTLPSPRNATHNTLNNKNI